MRVEDINSELKTSPFVPLRFHFSDGKTLDIPHPEVALVTRRAIYVAVYNRKHCEVPERAILCDPVHITRIEPINGRGRRKRAPAR